jgi:hypothetical protein
VSHEDFELNEIETTDPTPPGVVHLDGVALYLAGGPPQNQSVQFSDLARFQPKILFGDPSKDDNDLLSVYEFGNLSGGHGVEILKEGTDQQRYYFGTLQTRFPNVITKPPWVQANDTAAGDKRVLGEMYSADINDHIIVYMRGTAVRRGLFEDQGSGIHALDALYANITVNTTTFVPVNPGVAFQGTHTEERFFVPCGNDGYFIVEDTGTTIVESAAHKFSSFVVWDNKLIGITTGGRLYRCTDASGAPPTWTAYDLTWQLSKSYRIRGMVNYFDRRDEPCIYIITDRDLWQFEPDGPELFRIDNGWASHPKHGLAHAVWNGQLHVAVGMSVKRYTGGTWMDVGLDRDDGLPVEYHGYIVEMVAGTNALYAMVQAVEGFTATGLGAKSSIHQFNGSGWNCIWQQDTADPTFPLHGTDTDPFTMAGMTVTQSGGVQTLVWGTGGTDEKVYSMALTRTTANPRQAIRYGDSFHSGEYFFLELGKFNADLYGYDKIANSMQYKIAEPISQSAGFRDTVRWLYQIDDGDWEILTSHRADPGRYGVPFGDVIDGMPAGFTQGEQFEDITLRYEVFRASSLNVDRPSILEGAAMSFLKTVESNYSFTIAVDISNGSADGTMSADEVSTWIDALISRQPKRFISFTVGADTYRVFVSQNLGTKWTGDIQRGTRQLSILQIPTNKL